MNAPNKMEEVRRHLGIRPGAELECVENTLIPARAGVRLKLTRVGKNVCDAEVIRGHDAKPGECGACKEGPGYRFTLPSRVRDIVAIGRDPGRYATWKIGRDNHTATWRVIA